MEARYKKATIEDLDLLVDMRIKVLRAANMLSEETDMSEVRRCAYRYYKEALCNESHTAYLVFDGNNVIGTGGASFFSGYAHRLCPHITIPAGVRHIL